MKFHLDQYLGPNELLLRVQGTKWPVECCTRQGNKYHDLSVRNVYVSISYVGKM